MEIIDSKSLKRTGRRLSEERKGREDDLGAAAVLT